MGSNSILNCEVYSTLIISNSLNKIWGVVPPATPLFSFSLCIFVNWQLLASSLAIHSIFSHHRDCWVCFTQGNSLAHQDSFFMVSNFSSAEEFFSEDFWRRTPVLMFSKHMFLEFQWEARSLSPRSFILKCWVSVTFPLPYYYKDQFLLSLHNKTFLFFLKYFPLNLIKIPLKLVTIFTHSFSYAVSIL